LSIVIPVFNAEKTLESVVDRIHTAFASRSYEIVLVDDGSTDQSHKVCKRLVRSAPELFQHIQFAKNFGEHHAVLAGLSRARGAFIGVLDDDGQNPPEELSRMLDSIKTRGCDVVFGRYLDRKHPWFRRLGSWVNDQLANIMLKKPRGLYLSSFKVMNRFVVDEITNYHGPYPYLDGLICRTTNRLSQLDVLHDERQGGQSNYTARKLIRLWLNMFLGFSVLPLRISIYLGLITALSSIGWLLFILADKLWINPTITVGIPTVLACVTLFAGIQLIVLGMIGEYIGRIFLAINGHPMYVIRPGMNEGCTDG
jgi:undecaprenyl-phosphate 4-deoxy-4-formamido-L-arabinose transferase